MYIKIKRIIDTFFCPSDLIPFTPQNNIVKAVVNEQPLKALPHITTLLVSSQCTDFIQTTDWGRVVGWWRGGGEIFTYS